MIRSLLRYVGKYKKASLLTPLFAGLEVVMETLIPLITAMLIDEGIEQGNMEKIFIYGGWMLGAAFLSLGFAIGAGVSASEASTGFASNLRTAVYEKIQTFSFANIDKFSTSGLITRMTTDITSIQQAYQQTLRMAVRAPFTMILSFVMSLIINAKLALVFLAAIVLLALLVLYIIPRVSKIFSEMFRKVDSLNETVQENVSGIRVVKAYTREEYEKEKFSYAAGQVYKYSVKAEKVMALMNPFVTIIVYGSIIALSWFGAKLISSAEMTTGELTSFFSYNTTILMSLLMFSMVSVFITMSFAAMKRITEVLDEEPSINAPEAPVNEVADGSISFNNVSFAYYSTSEKNVLEDINIRIGSGETVGIIGATGSGKSSLVNLISRLYDVSEGSVEVGGIDVRRYDLEVLRKSVSVVLQKNVLFSGTILENLRWGREDATDEECIEACRMACADEFIEKMPDKYESHIEQGGTNVSGGQRQRLCIARALLKRPKILILDDSTSAVDTATDAKIRALLKSRVPEVTRIIIAQRISSVRDADRIIVLDDGRVDGSGTHDELLESNEIYKYIYETQTKNGFDFDEKRLSDSYFDDMEGTDNE